MTTWFGFLGAFFTIGAAGFGVAALLAGRRLSMLETAALAWLLGSATVSLSLWILGFFARGIGLQIMVSSLCIILGALGFSQWRNFPRPERRERKSALSKTVESIFAALLLLELTVIVYLSFRHTLGWDGLLIWELKARYAFLNGGTLPVTYFADTTRLFSHPEYPLLLPLTEAWFYLWIGDCDQFWIKLIFPIWYAAGMVILLLASSELSGRRWLGWTITLLFLFVPCIHSAPGGVQVGYADVPLGVVFLATIFYFLRFLRDGSRDSLALFVALGATLPWMKREGAILWAVLAVCGAIAIWRRRNLPLALASFLPGVSMIIAWKSFLRAVHALASPDFVPITLATARANMERVAVVGRELRLELCETSRWSIFWALVAVALLSVLGRERSARTFTLVVAFFAPLLVYCTAYIFSAWPNYIGHIEGSLPRLLIQLAPVGWLLIALSLAPTRRSL